MYQQGLITEAQSCNRKETFDETCAVLRKRASAEEDSPHLLHEYFPQPALTTRIVLQVELVEAMKYVLVCVHVKRVDIQIVPSQLQRLKNL